MSSTTSTAPAVCYTVTCTILVHGTPREHVAARNLLYQDAAAIVDDCIDRGIDVRMTPQPTTPFTAWTPPAR
jgi:hypothetical protein